MNLQFLNIFLILSFAKNVFLQNIDTDDYKIRPENVNGIKNPFFLRVELPLEIRAALYALKNSISHLQETKREIIEEVENALEKKLKVYHLELKNQFAKTKQETIVETDENVGQRLTETKNEMIVQMNSLEESMKLAISEIKSSIKEEIQEMTANTFSGLDEIKKQLNSRDETEHNVKQQLIESNNENIVQITELRKSVMAVYSDAEMNLTEAKKEVIDKINTLSESTELDHSKNGKRFAEIESIMQTQLHEITDLGNELIKTKHEIINETNQSLKEQLTQAKNAIVVQLSSLEESTKLAISMSENSTSEIQSSIKSQFREMESALNNTHDLNDIKNQLIAINETDKYVKEQLSETQNKILVQMNELRESRITVCSDIKNNLSHTKTEMVDQMKTIFSQSEKRISELQSFVQTRFKEFKDEVNLSEGFSEVKTQLTKTHKEILTEIEECRTVPGDCREVQRRGYKTSGIYHIQPMLSLEGFLVWCDMSTRGGGWTYVLNRFDGSQNFNLKWTDYKQGFGDLSGEHWLGLDHLYELTNSKSTELLFELIDWDLKTVHALYDNFKISDESERYRVNSLGNYSGDAGDSFSYHYNTQFSTTDNEDSSNCASMFDGAWWYKRCYRAYLTGKYIHNPVRGKYYDSAIKWGIFHGVNYSPKEARIMIRQSYL